MYYMNGKYFLVAADASQSTDVYYTEDLQTVVTVVGGQKPDFYLDGCYYKVAHTAQSFTVKKSTDLINWEVIHEETPPLMGSIQEVQVCYNGNHLYVGLKVDFMGMMSFLTIFRSTDFEVWEEATGIDHTESRYSLGAASKWTLSAIEDGHLFNGCIIKDAVLLHIYDNSTPSYLFGQIDRLYVEDEDVSDRVAILLGCKE